MQEKWPDHAHSQRTSGCPFRNVSSINFLPHTITSQFMVIPLSTSLTSFISTPLLKVLVLSDQLLDLSLMFPCPGILRIRQSDMASEPSGMLLPPSEMPCLEASRKGTRSIVYTQSFRVSLKTNFFKFNYWFLVLPAIMMVVVAIVLLWCVWCMCVFPHLCILWLHVLCMIMFFSSSVYPEEVSVGCAFVQLFCLYSFKRNVHCVHLVLALWTCTFCVEFLYAPYYSFIYL